MTIAFHPFADIFPLLEGQGFAELVEDIRVNGLREPVVVHEGAILDGRNRYRAAVEAGAVEAEARFSPRVLNHGYREFGSEAGDGTDALSFVISKNLRRRHLSESQRAMVAARLASLRPGRPPAAAGAAGPHPCPSPQGGGVQKPANLPDLRQGDAAGLLNVSERSVRSARSVVEHGTAGLAEAVTRGAVSVAAAAAIATLEPVEQDHVLVKVGSPEFAAEVRRLRAERQAGKRAARQMREAELGARQQALPEARFGVILADPEWRFEPWSRETGMDRAADNHYPTSAAEVIASRPVAAIAADDCVLFLWATVPMLPAALAVMVAWGFDYRSHFVWAKNRAGTGYWNRNRHELLLVGVKGDVPAPAMGTQWDSLIEQPAAAHSAKPEAFLRLIEDYFPSLAKIELNARGAARPGWEAWGLEAAVTAPSPDLACGSATLSPQAGRGQGEGRSADEDPGIPACLRRLPDNSLPAWPAVASKG